MITQATREALQERLKEQLYAEFVAVSRLRLRDVAAALVEHVEDVIGAGEPIVRDTRTERMTLLIEPDHISVLQGWFNDGWAVEAMTSVNRYLTESAQVALVVIVREVDVPDESPTT